MTNFSLPTSHLEKLNATLQNEKLPAADRSRVEHAVERYDAWVQKLTAVNEASVEATVHAMVALLNEYRLFIDLELIFDSADDFLYRQKGQLKLDNSVIEEFLPHLIFKCTLRDFDLAGVRLGPTTAFSAVYFTSSLNVQLPGGGIHVRTKDQDFAVAKRLYLRASHTADFSESVIKEFYLGYVVAECKTNLDKTMFQEAVATAHDVKTAVTGAKYYLICEWLDMMPQSTAATDIDEVLILRKAKRISSNVRSSFGTAAGRKRDRQFFVDTLTRSPFCPDVFLRFVTHISNLLGAEDPDEGNSLQNGYF